MSREKVTLLNQLKVNWISVKLFHTTAICPEMLATTKMAIEENLPNVLNEMVKDTQKKGRFRRNNESRKKKLKIIAKETPWKFGISMKTTNLGNLTKIRQRFVENSKRLQNGSHEKWSIWERFAEGWRKFKLHGKRPKLRAPWTVAILKKMVNFGEDSSKVGENSNERTKESGKWPL